MRVVLEIRGGISSGRKIWLLAGQAASVGRSGAADFVIADDPRLSGRHFQVHCEGDVCTLRDLNSTNGTLLNGVRVQEQPLRDGDEILAGQTRFLVSIAADAADAALRGATLARRAEGGADGPAPPSPPADQLTPSPPPPPPAGAVGRSALPMLVMDVQALGAVRRRIWLRPEGAALFGRSEAADQPFPHDEKMSSRHFVVEPTAAGWRCRDLGSTNGTFLNAQLVAECILHDGDRLTAGDTTFCIGLAARSDPGQAPAAQQAGEQTLRPRPITAMRPPRSSELVYRAIPCRSGLTLYLGQRSGFDPALLAHLLCKAYAPVVLASKAAVAAEFPPERQTTLPAPRALRGSPAGVVVAQPTPEECGALVARCWGKDAVVLALAPPGVPTAADEVLAWARSVAERPPGSRFQGWQPAALGEFLANSDGSDVVGLMVPLQGVFLELFQGDRWGIFAPAEREPELQLAGFRPAPARL